MSSERTHLAAALVSEAHTHNGLAPLDLGRFWADQAEAQRDPWSAASPQVPLGIGMGLDCVWTELGEKADWHRLFHDDDFRVGLARRYNDQAERIVGRRLLWEGKPDPALRWPPVKELADVFEARNVWHNESYWLQAAAHDPDGLAALLDRVEERLRDLRAFLLPAGWDEARRRITAAGGQVPRYRGQRGPVTFATSVYGPENLIFLILDRPDLAARFRDLILRAMLERARILDEEGGFTAASAPRGFYFCDDNCCLLNPDMYEFFGYPILKGVFDRYSPDAGDLRGQHSDSNMEHLLPLLGRLGLTSVNFGPTLSVRAIREHLPRAVIHGQLAPFTFSRNDEIAIVSEFLRDLEQARDRRGLVFATAGSINDGSRLTGMRLIMAAIQRYGRWAV
jgi:uroporphyrinogen decarboxylase